MSGRRSGMTEVKVWDPLVRGCHWILAASVALAFFSDGERALHNAAGYVALGLVGLRIIWGAIGPKHARFADFVAGPRAVSAYLRDLLRGRAARTLGHNPAGGAMILALLALVAITGISGWLSETDRFFAVGWVEDLHSFAAYSLIAFVGLHVAGVIASSLLHRENLVGAMITGKKQR